MEIKKLNISDVKGIRNIEEKCFIHPWSENSIVESFHNGLYHFFGYIKNDVLVGYIGINLVANEAYITNIAVLKQYRRRNFATELFKKAIEYSKNNKCMFVSLEVRENNISAINLYKKCGFTQTGLRKNFYTEPKENAIIMTYDFNKENENENSCN